VCRVVAAAAAAAAVAVVSLGPQAVPSARQLRLYLCHPRHQRLVTPESSASPWAGLSVAVAVAVVAVAVGATAVAVKAADVVLRRFLRVASTLELCHRVLSNTLQSRGVSCQTPDARQRATAKSEAPLYISSLPLLAHPPFLRTPRLVPSS